MLCPASSISIGNTTSSSSSVLWKCSRALSVTSTLHEGSFTTIFSKMKYTTTIYTSKLTDEPVGRSVNSQPWYYLGYFISSSAATWGNFITSLLEFGSFNISYISSIWQPFASTPLFLLSENRFFTTAGRNTIMKILNQVLVNTWNWVLICYNKRNTIKYNYCKYVQFLHLVNQLIIHHFSRRIIKIFSYCWWNI